MLRKLSFVLLCFLVVLNFACGTSETTNTNANQVTNISIDQTNLPPGFSTSPVNTNGATTPGIPDAANANILPKGATPTPGIPDPKTIGKTPMPRGTPPIPGIPDEETLKKQMNTIRNANDANQPPPAASQNNTSKISPIDRNRTVRKP